MSDIVQKLWGFCHTLRHDGIDYGDYIEQITYLLFLKMADERASTCPRAATWPTLRDKSGTDLTDHYIDVLRTLGKHAGHARRHLRRGAVALQQPGQPQAARSSLIDETEWTALDVDVKAAAYEGLLEKAASEGKKGAGQYFTPRVLIQSIVRCMKPDPRERGGLHHLRSRRAAPAASSSRPTSGSSTETKGGASTATWPSGSRRQTYFGQELVARPRRLALMNLYLHGIEPTIHLGDAIYEPPRVRPLRRDPDQPAVRHQGREPGPRPRRLHGQHSNKQLNFLQHVLTILKPGGRAAVVLPDNCLFADQAGEVFKILTEDCDLHTVLRLPRGTFTPYSQGVKANVVFFTKGDPTETFGSTTPAPTSPASRRRTGR